MRGYHIRLSLKPGSTSSFPRSIFQQLPNDRPQATHSADPTDKEDYRQGDIRIDWTDFAGMSKQAVTGKGRETGRGPALATFVPNATTKSGTANLPEGIVHVYREVAGKTRDDPAEFPPLSSLPDEASTSSDGIMLGVLAVPSWMTPSDFLGFVAPAAEGISHLRIIRDRMPNRSIAIINFPKVQDASEFIEAYNGKPFNSMEPELCHVVHVLSVNIDVEDPLAQNMVIGSPGSSVYELPTCPVCLERMDSAVTGLITVPCSHTFHCMCLSKWGDSRCPVCRYSQTLLSSHPTTSANRTAPIPFASEPSNQSACSSCSSTTNLWICLICGNIGCGRYGRAHAQAHYQSTTHLYALELETQRVWDYAGDGYVHRLIQNKADGKLVELPSASSSMGVHNPRDGGLGPSAADSLSAEKIEAIGIEYSYLLTSQLDSQRSYYEDEAAVLKENLQRALDTMESMSASFEQEKAESSKQARERELEKDKRIEQLQKDKNKLEGKVEKLTELSRAMEKQLREERAVSEGLVKNIQKMKEKAESDEKERTEWKARMTDMEEQLRDVMFFLQAKDKIENGEGAEAAGGSIEISNSQPPPPAANGRKKRMKKG